MLWGVINQYAFDFDHAIKDFRYKIFEHYNQEWLHFIVDCQSGKKVWKEYDIIREIQLEPRI